MPSPTFRWPGPQVYKLFCDRTPEGTIVGYDTVGLISAACALIAVGLSWTLIAAKPKSGGDNRTHCRAGGGMSSNTETQRHREQL